MLYKEPCITAYIKAQRLIWVDHVKRMSRERMPKLVLNRKLFGKKRKGRLAKVGGCGEREEEHCYSLQIKLMKCYCLYVACWATLLKSFSVF